MGAQILPSRSVLGPYGEQTPFFLIRVIPPISRLLGSRVIITFRKRSSTKSMSALYPSLPIYSAWSVSVIEHTDFYQSEYLSNKSKNKCFSINRCLPEDTK